MVDELEWSTGLQFFEIFDSAFSQQTPPDDLCAKFSSVCDSQSSFTDLPEVRWRFSMERHYWALESLLCYCGFYNDDNKSSNTDLDVKMNVLRYVDTLLANDELLSRCCELLEYEIRSRMLSTGEQILPDDDSELARLAWRYVVLTVVCGGQRERAKAKLMEWACPWMVAVCLDTSLSTRRRTSERLRNVSCEGMSREEAAFWAWSGNSRSAVAELIKVARREFNELGCDVDVFAVNHLLVFIELRLVLAAVLNLKDNSVEKNYFALYYRNGDQDATHRNFLLSFIGDAVLKDADFKHSRLLSDYLNDLISSYGSSPFSNIDNGQLKRVNCFGAILKGADELCFDFSCGQPTHDVSLSASEPGIDYENAIGDYFALQGEMALPNVVNEAQLRNHVAAVMFFARIFFHNGLTTKSAHGCETGQKCLGRMLWMLPFNDMSNDMNLWVHDCLTDSLNDVFSTVVLFEAGYNAMVVSIAKPSASKWNQFRLEDFLAADKDDSSGLESFLGVLKWMVLLEKYEAVVLPYVNHYVMLCICNSRLDLASAALVSMSTTALIGYLSAPDMGSKMLHEREDDFTLRRYTLFLYLSTVVELLTLLRAGLSENDSFDGVFRLLKTVLEFKNDTSVGEVLDGSDLRMIIRAKLMPIVLLKMMEIGCVANQLNFVDHLNALVAKPVVDEDDLGLTVFHQANCVDKEEDAHADPNGQSYGLIVSEVTDSILFR